jgi:hypothetical protein
MSRKTTLSVNRETHEKFKRAKPYDSLSADEFVEELIEEYERGDA